MPFASAMLIFGLLLQAAPHGSAARQALEHYRQGQSLLKSERWEEAKAEFRAAIRLDPLLVMAHYGLGQAQMATKDYSHAVRAFSGAAAAFHELAGLHQRDRMEADRLREDQIRSLQDQLRELRRQLSTPSQRGLGGQITVQNEIQRVEQQIESLRRLRGGRLEALETPAEISLALGSAYFRSEAFPDAEREYRAALRARPKLGEAHNNLAVVYMYMGRIDQAREQVRLAEKAGYRVHPELKNDIEKLRDSK